MTMCGCLLCKKKCNCLYSGDIIDKLNEVKTDVTDYFIIVEAVNEIISLRHQINELKAKGVDYGHRDSVCATDDTSVFGDRITYVNHRRS